jgi:epoxyqueuosine reductase QueG
MRDEIFKIINSAPAAYEKSSPHCMWREPVIKIISAENEKLNILKNAVDRDHLMPADVLPGAKSIISFFIPFHERIVVSNIGGAAASEEWAKAYIKTNDLIKNINTDIEKLMIKHGYRAGKIPATHNFDEKKLISKWSHRHIAYIAGIGTFGINNMLITGKGCCGRLGSILISYEFESYEEIPEPKEKCLYKINGSCGICRKKCGADAYGEETFDRGKCYKKCLENAERYRPIGYADVCGKCLVGLPCSMKDPSLNR